MLHNILLYFSPDDELAGGNGEIEASNADLSEGTVDNANEVEESAADDGSATTEEAPTENEVDMNSIYAKARRRAEEEAEKKYQSRIAELDNAFATQFGTYTNPKTGEKITSAMAYLDAVKAQQMAQMEEQLKSNGVDPKLIEDMINNNPKIKQAEEVLEKEKQRALNQQIENDIKELHALDESINTLADVPVEVLEIVRNKNVSLTDAYKLLNYGKWSKAKADAERQSAINQLKGKDHMKPVNGVATDDNMVEIPMAQRSLWETAFPDKTWAERTALYNKQLK